MRKLLLAIMLIIVLLLAAGGVAFVVYRPDRAIRSATGMVSHTLCSGTFVSGLNPGQVYSETILPIREMRGLFKRLHYRVDRNRREAVVDWAGGFVSRSVYRDGYGCTVIPDGNTEPQRPPLAATASTKSTAVKPLEILPKSAAWDAAVDRAFAESGPAPERRVKAVVILHKGRLVAERYAAGYTPETPILGYSLSKSVTNALFGILVRQGKLKLDQPAPFPEWQSDPRRSITLHQLLAMSSGLALEENGSGFDPVSRMLFLEPDMARYAATAQLEVPPGTRWSYTSGNTLLLARAIRDAIGGNAATVRAFADRELFQPLGMNSMVMEFDLAGTPAGSTYMLASARDWAKFGLLYLHDGIISGQRILPEGWVQMSATPTLNSSYGAGFWVNRGDDPDARGRVRTGMPVDAFFGSGLFGQRVVIVPSAELVIVRLGLTHTEDYDIAGLVKLVSDAVELSKQSPSSEAATPKAK